MKKKTISIELTEFESLSELNTDEQSILAAADKAVEKAYAPYSQFNVGAAVVLDDGSVITGNNQENTAYPSGMCAERVAIFTAKSSYPDKEIVAIAITANSNNFVVNYPITPCGACRQVIAETEKRQKRKIKILMKGFSGPIIKIVGVDNLLPLLFHEEKLKK